MKTLVSLGDQSRTAYLRQANHLLKSRLAVLVQEATTGLKSDIPAAMQGNMSRITQVETRLNTLAAYHQNTSLAEGEFSALQEAMGAIETISLNLSPHLQAAGATADETSVTLRSTEAKEDFQTVIRMINTNAGGRYVLSGTAVQTQPLSDAAEIMADLKVAISGAASPGEMIARVFEWFDAPAGGGGFVDAHYRGSDQGTTTGVSEQVTVRNDTRASDGAFRDVLKGLALATLAGDSDITSDSAGRALLMREGGKALAKGTYEMTLSRAGVGLKQELIEQAAARNASERTSLAIARSDLLGADPYETSSALTQTEANLQNLYALTARLSRLSLTEYLR